MKFSTLFLVTLTTVATANPIISLELAERQIMTDSPTNICHTCALVIDLYTKVRILPHYPIIHHPFLPPHNRYHSMLVTQTFQDPATCPPTPNLQTTHSDNFPP